MAEMAITAFLRRGVVYIPTMNKATAGFYVDTEPVAVVPVTDRRGLRLAFLETVARGNPVIPTPARDQFLTDPVVIRSKARSWRLFVHDAAAWHILKVKGLWQIVGQRLEYGDALVPDQDRTIGFPSGASAEEVIDRMVEILEATARA